MSGASTNPDPEVFAYKAAQVKDCMDATMRLGGENYVLWGGREGYETILNTNIGLEMDNLKRFLQLVVEYKGETWEDYPDPTATDPKYAGQNTITR